jgi:hypothetical protein
MAISAFTTVYCLHIRPISLPVNSSFEELGVCLQHAGFNFVVVYRPGTKKVTDASFDNFNDLLERMSFHVPSRIVYFSNHMDSVNTAGRSKVIDDFAVHNWIHVSSPTHFKQDTRWLLKVCQTGF